MSLKFDEIKDVDDYIKNIVNGYIHTSQSLLPHEQNTYYIIPPLVGYLITAYYYEPECFAFFPESITKNEKKDVITHSSLRDISIFGNMKISKNLYCNKFIWTLKISNCCIGLSIAIGIDADSSKDVESLFDCNERADVPFYAYESYYRKYSQNSFFHYFTGDMKESTIRGKYGICYVEQETENILKMALDTKNKTLRYYVNEKDQGIAVDDVMLDNNEEYTLAISAEAHVTVQLLQFQQIRE